MAAVVSSLAIASRHRSAKESSHHQLSCKQNLRSEAVLRLHNTQIKVVELSKAFCKYHMFDNFLSEFSSQNALQKRVRSKGFILKIQKNNSFRIETETESNCVNNFNNLISTHRKSNEKIGPKNSGLFTIAKYPVYPDRNELHNHFYPLPHSLGGLTSQANLTAQPRRGCKGKRPRRSCCELSEKLSTQCAPA